jgi:hypothetical protein
MSHVVEVDQSGRIEETNRDTVLAFSDGIQFSVLIPSRVKQDCLRALRLQGIKGNLFYIQFFAIGLFYLLRGHIEKIDRVTIDREYLGHEGQIKDYLINCLFRSGLMIDSYKIEFSHIGEHPPVHTLAISTFRKAEKPNLVLSSQDIMKMFKL